nr:hypothetical protein DVH24_007722 [Ipomoea batatas]
MVGSLSEGLCSMSLVTLPVAGSHSMPSHPPPQQSLPLQEDNRSVVSFTILALNPRRATLSPSAQAAANEVERLTHEDSKPLYPNVGAHYESGIRV